MFNLVLPEWLAVSLAANDIDRAHSGNNIKMTALERGTPIYESVLGRRVEFRYTLNPALDPEGVAIDPLAHI
jgi:hypothetical protein